MHYSTPVRAYVQPAAFSKIEPLAVLCIKSCMKHTQTIRSGVGGSYGAHKGSIAYGLNQGAGSVRERSAVH
jgi:hypothetical protein